MESYSALAASYDELTQDVGYEKRAAFVEKLFLRSHIPVHTVLDLACGTGTMTALLTERGYELIGVDGSEDMLLEAREKAQTLTGVPPLFLHQSMPELDLYGTVEAAICCLDSLNYLTDAREVRETFRKRSRVINAVRDFLNARGFLEVDTPVLHTLEIGAAARTFKTHHNALDIDMFLRIETELYLKRLIVGGFDRVYEVGRLFRNEGMDATHNPEFTSVETYQAYADYNDVMEMVEELYAYVARTVCGSTCVPYEGQMIELKAPWRRVTMAQAVKDACGVDYDSWKTDEEARACLDAMGVHVEKEAKRGDCLAALFDEYVESTLVQPTFVTDYPVDISPLAKRKQDNPDLTERFEYFINGHEFGNAFSELNDPIDQRARFEEQVRLRHAQGIMTAQVDEDFLNALEYGMPPTGGLGFGVDRMVMLMTDNDSIRDVLLFPTMKPLKSGTDAVQQACKTVSGDEKAEPEKIDFSKVEIEPLFQDYVDFETFSKSDFRAVKVLACEAVPKSKKLLKFTLDDGTGENRTILSGIHAYYEPEELVGKTCIAITNLPPRQMMGMDSCGMLISAVHHEEGKEKLHLLMVDDHIPAGAKLY